jgi:hypothetical protein
VGQEEAWVAAGTPADSPLLRPNVIAMLAIGGPAWPEISGNRAVQKTSSKKGAHCRYWKS